MSVGALEARAPVPRGTAGRPAPAGPMGALSRAHDSTGQAVPSPVSRAGGGNPNMFPHSGRAPGPDYHGSGATRHDPVSAIGGLMAAAQQDPSPDAPHDTIELGAHAAAQVARINRRLAYPLMVAAQEDLLMFVEMERRDPVSRGYRPEERRYTQLSAPALNWVLAANSTQPETPADVIQPEEILTQYAFDGIVSTEEGKDSQFYHNEAGAERLFNTRIRGTELTHNVFGNNVRTGTNLFCIFKKESVAGKVFRVDPIGSAMPLPTRVMSSRPFQVSFYGDHRHTEPPAEALAYIDEFGKTGYGVFVRVGVAGNVAPQFYDAEQRARAAHDFAAMIALPKLKVLIAHVF